MNNEFTAFEFPLPQFPTFEVARDFEFDLEKKKVYFSLVLGDSYLACEADCKVEVKRYLAVPQGQSPENAVEQDFEYLFIERNVIAVVDNDIWFKNEKIELSEAQLNELNENIETDMVDECL